MPAIQTRHMGQPIAALGAVLVLWVIGRVMLWEAPFPAIADAVADLPLIASNQSASPVESASSRGGRVAPAGPMIAVLRSTSADARTKNSASSWADTQPSQPPGPSTAHDRLGMSEPSHVPASPEVVRSLPARRAFESASSPEHGISNKRRPKRWSLDSWVFYRQNGTARSSLGQLPATYGASQAGAILRYRFGDAGQAAPFAYARLTSALSGPEQVDVAAGVGVRPIAGVPLSTLAEMRVSRSAGRTDIRPAVFAVTELPHAALPFAARGEAYLQGGYVGGDFATPFVDGQVKIDREVVDFDLASVRAGAAVWGGAQKSAERLDVGPSASVDFKLADQPVRLSVDYRQRVAGDAQPPSGIALTLSTGF